LSGEERALTFESEHKRRIGVDGWVLMMRITRVL
jgi:hypothetical protein